MISSNVFPLFVLNIKSKNFKLGSKDKFTCFVNWILFVLELSWETEILDQILSLKMFRTYFVSFIYAKYINKKSKDAICPSTFIFEIVINILYL